MSSNNEAGPSGICGLTPKEVQKILEATGGEDNLYLDSAVEPFSSESDSEYFPSSYESEESEIGLEVVEDVNLSDDEDDVDDVMIPENIDYSNLDITWVSNEFHPSPHMFDNEGSGLKDQTLDENSEEVDFFFHLFSEDIAEFISNETNRYARQQQEKKWNDVSVAELYIFIGLTMLMTRNKKLDIKEYWSIDNLLHSPIFRTVMSRDRYVQILRCLHFTNNEEAPLNNRLYKIDEILRLIKNNFQAAFCPFQNLVIDESMVLFKGRLSFKQYIKSKRHRFGIKLYVLCDCETGYVLDFVVYIGQETGIQVENVNGLGSSGSVVAALMKPYLNLGHTLFTDNYYSSPILSNFLYEKKTNSCGTVRLTRKHMPKLKNKLKKGETSWACCNNMLVIKWKDRRDVTMITTMHKNEMVKLNRVDRVTKEPIIKPLCVLKYNERMGGVDRSDMMISSISCMRKSTKWYRKLFFHTLDICLLNAHALFLSRTTKIVPFADFQLKVIRQIFARYPIFLSRRGPGPGRAPTNPSRLSERHFPSFVASTAKNKNPCRRCVVCSNTCEGVKKRRDSRYMCQDCNVGLCVVPCFKIYHTKAKF